MVRHHISYELKEKALSLYLQGRRDADVSYLTGVNINSLRRLRRTDSLFSSVSIVRGRPRLLTSEEVEVCVHSPFSVTGHHLTVL